MSDCIKDLQIKIIVVFIYNISIKLSVFRNILLWEQEKLESKVQFISGLTYSPKSIRESGTLVIRSSNIKNGNFVSADDVYVDSNVVNSSQINKNDIIMVIRNGSRNLIGKHALITHKINNSVIGAFMLGFRTPSFSFINSLLDTSDFKREIYKNLGATINQITIGNLKEMNFLFPNYKEMDSIGKIFSKLNCLITLYERKIKLLSQIKKYFLDNLFAENEYPNLRFKGFTNAWEQRKLKELVNHKSGTSIEKYFSINGTYKVISIGSYGLNNKYIDQGIRAEENEVTKKKVVQKNQLTMVLNDKTVSGQIIGRCLLINKNNTYVVNQRTEIIIPNKEINSNYAYYYLNGPFRKKVKKISQGGTQIYVNYSSVEKQKFFYPYNYQEQIKIKNILKNLDDYITFYENKYCQFKQIKKELLYTMFI